MTRLLLRCMTGKENWKNHSASLYAFHVPIMPGAREAHLGSASRDPSSVVTASRTGQSHPAKPGYSADLGAWTDATYELPAGEIVKVQGSKAGAFGSMSLTGFLYLQMRADAALNRVKLYLSQDPAARFSVVYVEGRFDLLTIEEAEVVGARTLPHFKHMGRPEITNRLFTIEVVEPQIRARVVLERRTVIVGEDAPPVSIVRRRRTRLMQL